MKYYQIGIKTKSNLLRTRFDVTDINEVMARYVTPYAQSKDIVLGGTKISSYEIQTFYIMELDCSIKTWVSQMNYRYEDSPFIYENNDIFDCPEYNVFDDIYERVSNTTTTNDLKTSNESGEEKQQKNKDIFIVHGHDEKMLLDVENFVLRIGYRPVVLKNEPSQGQTIIEKIEKNSNVCYAIILYSPCDKGCDANKPKELKNRARQNVVFEHGFLYGKIGRKKVCALVQDDMEIPGDIGGVVFVQYRRGWQLEIVKELKSIGLSIDDEWM